MSRIRWSGGATVAIVLLSIMVSWCVVPAAATSCTSISDNYVCSSTSGCGWCSPQSAYETGTSCCLDLPQNLAPGERVSCSCNSSVNVFAVILTIAGAVAFCVCIGFMGRRYCCPAYRYGAVGAGGGYLAATSPHYQQFPVNAVPVQGVPYQQSMPGQPLAPPVATPSYYAPASHQGYYEAQPSAAPTDGPKTAQSTEAV